MRVLEPLLVHVAIFGFLVYFLAAFRPDPARSSGENRQRSAAIVREVNVSLVIYMKGPMTLSYLFCFVALVSNYHDWQPQCDADWRILQQRTSGTEPQGSLIGSK